MQLLDEFTHPFDGWYPFKTLNKILLCDLVLTMKISAQFIHEGNPVEGVKGLTRLFGKLAAGNESVTPRVGVIFHDGLIKIECEQLFLRRAIRNIWAGGHFDAG